MDWNKNQTEFSANIGQFYGKHCTVGIDEAGRGPVLGPMVYCVGICLSENLDQSLPSLGVADSKTLNEEKREEIFAKMSVPPHVEYFAFILKILSPHFISTSMLKRCKYNLNEISHDAAAELLSFCQDKGILVDKVYVDTVGPPEAYQKKLEHKFPRFEFCVSKKADSLYPVVSAASICAKVTRDKILKNWRCKEYEGSPDSDLTPYGSGYPADPVTKAFMEQAIDPVFGYPSLVRFSWSTTQDIMDKRGVQVLWEDDGKNEKTTVKSKSLTSFFGKKRSESGAICNAKQLAPVRHPFFQEMNIKSVDFL